MSWFRQLLEEEGEFKHTFVPQVEGVPVDCVNALADAAAAVLVQTFAGDVGHLWKTSESLLVYQELVRKGVRGLM